MFSDQQVIVAMAEAMVGAMVGAMVEAMVHPAVMVLQEPMVALRSLIIQAMVVNKDSIQAINKDSLLVALLVSFIPSITALTVGFVRIDYFLSRSLGSQTQSQAQSQAQSQSYGAAGGLGGLGGAGANSVASASSSSSSGANQNYYG